MAAKAKYKKWLERENLILLEGWCMEGMTDEQIAERMEINVATLYDWKKKHPPINEALKKGKEVVDFAVANALLRRAMKGDVTACIFWLKNRRRDKWRDKWDQAESMADIEDVTPLAELLTGGEDEDA